MRNISRHLFGTILIAAAILLLGGCGGNAPYSPILEGAGNSFAFTVAADSVTVEQGASPVFRLNLRALGSFSSPVTLTVTDLPMEWHLEPSTVVAPSSSGAVSTLSIDTSRADPGDYAFTVTATGGGVTRSLSLTLKVTGISVAIEPPAQTLVPGGTATYTVRVTPINGHAMDAALTVSGLPGSIRSSLSPTVLSFSGSSPRTAELVLTRDTTTPQSSRGSGNSVTFTVTATSGHLSASASGTVIVEDTGGIEAIIR